MEPLHVARDDKSEQKWGEKGPDQDTKAVMQATIDFTSCQTRHGDALPQLLYGSLVDVVSVRHT